MEDSELTNDLEMMETRNQISKILSYHSLQLALVYHINFNTLETIFICRECCRNFNYVSPLLWALMQSHLILILKFSTEKLFLNEFRDFGFNTGRPGGGGGGEGRNGKYSNWFLFCRSEDKKTNDAPAEISILPKGEGV